MPSPFRLYNTLTNAPAPFEPLVDGQVDLYVCGMTVYDDAHIGHARAMTVFDAFVGYLRHRGWTVRYIRNVTDVDDKIIARAAEQRVDALDWADKYTRRFQEDMAALGLAAPDAEPRVSDNIGVIVTMIEQLIENGHAYATDGSVWFHVPGCADYGALSGQKVDQLRSDDANPGKQHPADFALWKAAKAGEPSWDSPWGPGRPGWHIECSAMACSTLGKTIDIHGGGLDLVFPHHENEIAQSTCANREPYARYWMHNGLLTMPSGQKMGKSLGNSITIRDLLESYPSEALRLYYLQCHYRSPLPYDDNALPDALGMLARLYEAREVAESMAGDGDADAIAERMGPDAQDVLRLARDFETPFHSELDNDFNTAAALGHLFELSRAINKFSMHKKARSQGGPVVAAALEAYRLVADALGLMRMSTVAFHDHVKATRLPQLGCTANDIDALLAERSTARADKNWDRADAIRDELDKKSIVIMDRPDGTEWRIKL